MSMQSDASINSGRLWRSREVLRDQRNESVALLFQKDDLGNSRLVSLAFVPKNIMEHLEEKVTGHCQHGDKSHVAHLLASWEEMAGLWMVGDQWVSCTWSVARHCCCSHIQHGP